MTDKSKSKISLGNRFTSYFPHLAYFELILTTEAFLYPHPCLAAFCFVVQAGLELGPQPQPPECGVYGLVPSCSRIIVDQGDFSQNDDPFSLFLCDELSL